MLAPATYVIAGRQAFIAAQLGHADGGALALRAYVHPHEENKRRAAAHLDRIIGAQG